MYICTELIEEIGRPPGLIFGLARTSSSFGRFFIHLMEHILLKFFSLVILLDMAKDRKIIDHDPRLFNKNSRIKSSREMLLYFSRNFLQGGRR